MATGPAAVAQVRVHHAEVGVLDIMMPSVDEGIAAALEIREWPTPTPVMLLSQHIETRRTVDLVTSGGIGYLLKDRVLDVNEFVTALDRVAAGGAVVDPGAFTRLLGAARADRSSPSSRPAPRDPGVTPRTQNRIRVTDH